MRYNRNFQNTPKARPDLVIRPLVAEDEEAWRKLWSGYLTFYEAELSDAVTTATFARILADDQATMRGRLLEIDGKPQGLVHFVTHRHCWRVEKVCYLQDLYANPEVRGGGLGRALIEAVYAEADRMGTPTVYWMTQEFNATARKLYDRIGMLTPFIEYDRPE
ncbi:MAG: GNAT family N-acetyltransferase [Cereibacter sphaeroides]|uniref:GNAT family N-acetyltransferase n=1 Tax=Cereibacter sphaeroides TaxID=1063 RepID=A0A2W5SGH8_CERSP|nr:MAG: GNAT family N-acetyltransferase [Cereibacter sphaeroides]